MPAKDEELPGTLQRSPAKARRTYTKALDAAYTNRPKASPDTNPTSDSRVRHDRVDNAGKVTLRHHGRLFHIGIGRPHASTPIILLIHNLDIRIIHAATGELLRQLTLDPTRTYQPTGNKRGGPKRPYGPRKNKQPEP